MATFPTSIDAVCALVANKEVYFFLGEYLVKYDMVKKRVVKKPQLISEAISKWPKKLNSPSYAVSQRAFLSPGRFRVQKDQYYTDIPTTLKSESTTPWDPSYFGDYSKFVRKHESQCEFNKCSIHIIVGGRSISVYQYPSGPQSMIKALDVPLPPDLPKITSVLYYPPIGNESGSVIFFSGENCYDYGNAFENFSVITKKIPPTPKAEKIVHKFKGLPLNHTIEPSLIQNGKSKGENFINTNRDKIKSLEGHLSKIANHFDSNKIKSIPRGPLSSLQSIPGVREAIEWGRTMNYGIFWIGLIIEGSYFLKLNGIDGIAFEISTSKYSGFSTVSLGVGLNIGAEAGIVIGYHKGNLEEFSSVEWDIDAGLEFEAGAQLSFEFSGIPTQGVTFEGISLGIGIGAEVKLSGGILYRFTHAV